MSESLGFEFALSAAHDADEMLQIQRLAHREDDPSSVAQLLEKDARNLRPPGRRLDCVERGGFGPSERPVAVASMLW